MKHLGDYDASTVIYDKFTTYRPSTGAAYTLGGTPALSVYKDNSTTQSTTGVTLTADFDSVTGLNHFAIDTSADGTFYSAGSFFQVVITTGTVDSVSVVGTVVASFTIRKSSALRPVTAGRELSVDASNRAAADAVAISGDSGAADNAEAFFDGTGYAGTNNVIPTVTTVNGFGAGAITAASIAADAITAAKIADGAIDAATFATGAITAASLAADAGAEIADAVWDEALAGHATAGSAGAALSAAGSAGDPWSTLLPGAYGAGTAGQIVGDYINATISSRSTLDAAGVRTAIGMASANMDTQLDALPTAVENADALLGRNIAGGSSSGRTVKQALYFLRNRWTASGGTLTVYETDDSTSSWTGVLSSSASADPITGNDPA